jgi:hypothetical protein
MCKRKNPTDPLVREFLQTYSINLLPLPRQHARPGELYIKTAGTVKATPGWINEIIEPEVELPEPFGETLPSLSGVVSEMVDANFGLKLLENFLFALGIPPGILDNVKLGYHKTNTTQVAFQFNDVSRQSIDPFTIGGGLIGRRLRPNPFVQEGNQYYVAAAFVWSPSIVVHARDAACTEVDLGAGLIGAVDADAGVKAERAADGAMTYKGREPVAFGVELYDLEYDSDRQSFLMGTQKQPVALMRGRRTKPTPAFPAENDEALLTVEEFEPAAAS